MNEAQKIREQRETYKRVCRPLTLVYRKNLCITLVNKAEELNHR